MYGSGAGIGMQRTRQELHLIIEERLQGRTVSYVVAAGAVRPLLMPRSAIDTITDLGGLSTISVSALFASNTLYFHHLHFSSDRAFG